MELTKEDRQKIFESLPATLQDAIFSEDTADAIWNICNLHDVNEIPIVAETVGKVLMGLLPPERFADILKKKTPNLDEGVIKKVAAEVQHYIFNPVIDDLMAIYSPEKLEQLTKELEPEIKASFDRRKDTYREKIED